MHVSAVVKQALARINGLYGLGLGLGLGIGVVGWGEPAEGDNAVAISGVNTVVLWEGVQRRRCTFLTVAEVRAERLLTVQHVAESR